MGSAAEAIANMLARKSNCGCKVCVLGVLEAKVALFVAKESLRAAFTGDRSGLESVVAKVEEIKAARAAG